MPADTSKLIIRNCIYKYNKMITFQTDLVNVAVTQKNYDQDLFYKYLTWKPYLKTLKKEKELHS